MFSSQKEHIVGFMKNVAVKLRAITNRRKNSRHHFKFGFPSYTITWPQKHMWCTFFSSRKWKNEYIWKTDKKSFKNGFAGYLPICLCQKLCAQIHMYRSAVKPGSSLLIGAILFVYNERWQRKKIAPLNMYLRSASLVNWVSVGLTLTFTILIRKRYRLCSVSSVCTKCMQSQRQNRNVQAKTHFVWYWIIPKESTEALCEHNMWLWDRYSLWTIVRVVYILLFTVAAVVYIETAPPQHDIRFAIVKIVTNQTEINNVKDGIVCGCVASPARFSSMPSISPRQTLKISNLLSAKPSSVYH